MEWKDSGNTLESDWNCICVPLEESDCRKYHHDKSTQSQLAWGMPPCCNAYRAHYGARCASRNDQCHGAQRVWLISALFLIVVTISLKQVMKMNQTEIKHDKTTAQWYHKSQGFGIWTTFKHIWLYMSVFIFILCPCSHPRGLAQRSPQWARPIETILAHNSTTSRIQIVKSGKQNAKNVQATITVVQH